MTEAAATVQAAVPRVTDYLRPEELRQPRTHVVAADLAEVQGLRHWSRAELWQRAKAAELKPVTVALLLLLRTVRGLKGGPLGCGTQTSNKELAAHLGFSTSHVSNALRDAQADGYIVRHQQELPVAKLTRERAEGPSDVLLRWHHKGAVQLEHGKAEAVAVTYLTEKGARLVDSLGTTRAFLRVPTKGGRLERQQVATGLMWRLWKTLRRALAAARCRVAAVQKKCRADAQRLGRKELSSTTSCSSSPDLWETPTAGDMSGDALARAAISESDSAAQGPPSSAGTQAHAPPGSAEHLAERQAPHTSRPGGDGVALPPMPESLVARLPEALREPFRMCWQHTREVPTYRQPHKRFARGDALVQDGTRVVWAPRMTAATAAPNRWRVANGEQRSKMVADFQPLRDALTVAVLELRRQQANEAETAAAEAARAAAEHEQLLAEVEALERKRRQLAGGGRVVSARKGANVEPKALECVTLETPVGTPVLVLRDTGVLLRTWTRSNAWTLNGALVVMVHGTAGCHLAARVYVDNGSPKRADE